MAVDRRANRWGALVGLACAALAFRVAPAAAHELPPIPKNRIVVNNLSLFRWNPIGLENQLRLGYARKLYERDDSRLLRDNFVWTGTYLRLNPASVRAAGMVELQPLAVLNLRFSAEVLRFFGTFTFVQSRTSAAADLSDTALKANRTGAFANYGSGGVHLTFEPLLQVKVGPIAVRNRALLGWFDLDLRAGDTVWYEATLDVAAPNRGWVFANDFDVLWQRPLGQAVLTAGVRVSSVWPQYGAEHGAHGVANEHHRVGVLAAYTFFDHGYTSFNKPSVLLISSWYRQHRYRTGQDVGRGVPYVVLGFAFQSDLLDAR